MSVRTPAFLLLLFVCPLAAALDPSRALTQYVQTAWRMEEGLPHNTVRSLVQTRDGYLWLGTYAGLVRFDGVRFVVFDTLNSKLRHNEIRALAEDRDGTLWIGTTAGGLHRFVDGAVEPWDRGIEHRTITELVAAPDGTLWVGTSGGLYALKAGGSGQRAAGRGQVSGASSQGPGRGRLRNDHRERGDPRPQTTGNWPLTTGNSPLTTRFAEAEGLANSYIDAVAVDGDALWVGTQRGLFRLHDERATRVASPRFDDAEMTAVFRDRRGHIWAGTRNQAVEFQWDPAASELREVRTLELPGVWGWIQRFLEDRDGNLWIGSYGGGLFRWTHGRVERITTEDGLLDHRPWALLEDAEGSLWLGTRSGLARLRDGAAIAISVEEGLPAPIARCVFEDSDGTIWIGHEKGLSALRDGRLRNFTATDGLPVIPVRTILRDRAGRFWIGGDGGIVEMDSARGRFGRVIGVRDGLPSTGLRTMLEDRRGRIWVGTDRGVALAEKGLGGPLRKLPELGDLSVYSVEAIYEDREGAIWLGTLTGGLRRWIDNAGSAEATGRVETPTLLQDASVGVRSFHQDSDGTFYIGTLGSGLFIRTPGREFRRVTTREGMSDDSIWSILPVGTMLWMSSDRGVFGVPRSTLFDVIEERASRVTVERLVGTSDGMKSRECNGGGKPAGVVARDGRIWVPTSRGAVAIDPSRLSLNRRPPPVAIEEVVIDRRLQPRGTSIEVAPGSRNIEIHFTGLSFVDPSRVRFRYRLEGYDEGWNDTGARRTAYFASLPPGDFELHVQAANNDGVWNTKGARLRVRVLPRLDQTWWFRTLVVLAVIAAAWAFLHLRARRQRARVDELRRLVAERTDEIERANAQLARLASIDDLTGIANHRRFVATLEEEWSRAQRDGQPLSLLLCDIDDFKAYNDTYGHPAGDAALRTVAETMAGALPRRIDLAARYGGEEFAVILPATDESGAREVAARILAAVPSLGIEHRGSRAASHLTLSIGCATARPAPGTRDSMNDLITAADQALYAAKAGGRNRVV